MVDILCSPCGSPSHVHWCGLEAGVTVDCIVLHFICLLSEVLFEGNIFFTVFFCTILFYDQCAMFCVYLKYTGSFNVAIYILGLMLSEFFFVYVMTDAFEAFHAVDA